MMDVIQLSTEGKRKPIAQVGKDLGLRAQFASPAELQGTVLLLSKHIDELRMRVHLLEAERARRWWHPIRDAYRRWRLR